MSRSIEHLHDAHIRARDHLQTSLDATHDFINRQQDEESNSKKADEERDVETQQDTPLDPDTFSSQLMTLSRDTTRRLKGIFSKVQKEYSNMEEAATFAAMATSSGLTFKPLYICMYIHIHIIV